MSEFSPLQQARKDAENGVPQLDADTQRYGDWVGSEGNVAPQAAADFANYLESRPELSPKQFEKLAAARAEIKDDVVNVVRPVEDKPWMVHISGVAESTATPSARKVVDKYMAKNHNADPVEAAVTEGSHGADETNDAELIDAYNKARGLAKTPEDSQRVDQLKDALKQDGVFKRHKKALKAQQKEIERGYDTMTMPEMARKLAKAEHEGDTLLANDLSDRLLGKMSAHSTEKQLSAESEENLWNRIIGVKDRELAQLGGHDGSDSSAAQPDTPARRRLSVVPEPAADTTPDSSTRETVPSQEEVSVADASAGGEVPPEPVFAAEPAVVSQVREATVASPSVVAPPSSAAFEAVSSIPFPLMSGTPEPTSAQPEPQVAAEPEATPEPVADTSAQHSQMHLGSFNLDTSGSPASEPAVVSAGDHERPVAHEIPTGLFVESIRSAAEADGEAGDNIVAMQAAVARLMIDHPEKRNEIIDDFLDAADRELEAIAAAKLEAEGQIITPENIAGYKKELKDSFWAHLWDQQYFTPPHHEEPEVEETGDDEADDLLDPVPDLDPEDVDEDELAEQEPTETTDSEGDGGAEPKPRRADSKPEKKLSRQQKRAQKRAERARLAKEWKENQEALYERDMKELAFEDWAAQHEDNAEYLEESFGLSREDAEELARAEAEVRVAEDAEPWTGEAIENRSTKERLTRALGSTVIGKAVADKVVNPVADKVVDRRIIKKINKQVEDQNKDKRINWTAVPMDLRRDLEQRRLLAYNFRGSEQADYWMNEFQQVYRRILDRFPARDWQDSEPTDSDTLINV